MYPAYPQHCFSLWSLVHICIPHTGTPCGRVIGHRSYGLSWVTPFGIALPSPFVPLLYHTLRDLSRTFLSSFWCDGLESNQQVPVRGFHSGICSFTLGVHALDYHHIFFVSLLYHTSGDLSRGNFEWRPCFFIHQ